MVYPRVFALVQLGNDGIRQMVAVPEAQGNSFQDYLNNVATRYGDWYTFPSTDAVNRAITQAQSLGAQAYNLPHRG
jgi:hypothetical protein